MEEMGKPKAPPFGGAELAEQSARLRAAYRAALEAHGYEAALVAWDHEAAWRALAAALERVREQLPRYPAAGYWEADVEIRRLVAREEARATRITPEHDEPGYWDRT